MTFIRWVIFCLLIFTKKSRETWRYGNEIGQSELFNTRNPIKLEYLFEQDGVEIEWHINGNCVVSNKSSQVASLTCSKPGQYKVDLKLNGSSTEEAGRYINVQAYHACYRWYLVKSDNQSLSVSIHHENTESTSDHTMDIYKVWVVNDQHVSARERNGTAQIPSAYSQVLSKQFHYLGQQPHVQFALQSKHMPHREVTLREFDQNLGIWIFSISSHPEDVQTSFKIIGKRPVAVYECFIEDTFILQPEEKYQMMRESRTEDSIFTANKIKPRMMKDPCMQNVAVVLARDELLMSQDNFASTQHLGVPAGFQGGRTIDWVTFIDDHIVLLINGSVYLRGKTNESLLEIEGLPGDILGIRGRDTCSEGVLALRENSHFVAFSNTKVYLCTASTVEQLEWPQTLLQLENLLLQDPQVQDVAFNTFPGSVGILLAINANGQSKVVVLLYNIYEDVWEITPMWMDFNITESGPLSFMFQDAGKTAFLLRDLHRLYYSYEEGTENGVMTLLNCNTSDLVEEGEFIQEVTISPLREIIIHTSRNHLFHSKMKMNQVLKLESGELPSSDVVVRFDALDRMYLMVLENGTLTSRIYPLKNEISSGLFPLQQCPYRYFVHSTVQDLYKIDMGESIHVWAMLVFLDIHSGFLQMFNHNSTLVKSRANSDIQYGRGVIAHNKSVTFYHHMDFYRSPNYTTAKKLATGISCFELIPSNINLICPSPTQIVSYLSVGCPKGRHLVLKRPAASEPCDTVDTYTIGKEHFLHLDGTSPTQDKVVHYDLVRLGCPVRVDSSHNFLPQLELYDGEEFVRPVTGNFILWEEQGRTDYSYNATMKQAGCHKVAQTWSQIREEQGMLTDWGQGWGPWNYRSCFEETNTVIDNRLLQRPYQILNSTGVSWLQFPNTHDSMYTFRARIVDPNYSFCDLEISFAVQTYGAQHPEDLTVTMITVGGIMGAVLLGLLGSYFVYRKQTSQAFATRMMLVKMLHKEDHSHQRESPVPKKRTSVLGDIWS